MKNELVYIQQGDVLLAKVDTSVLPNDLVLEMSPSKPTQKEQVIAYGEGHHEHVFVGGDIEILQSTSTKERFVRVTKETKLSHLEIGSYKQAEHKPQTITPGVYKFGQVIEFDPFTQLKRSVID